jgi:O-antigen/teichoic acid export membrane protein
MTSAAGASHAHVVRVQGKSLLESIGSSVVASGVYRACQWGVLIALAQLGSRAMLGQYALALAIATPVFALMSLNGRAVQASDAAHDYSFRIYLSLRLLTTLLALAIIAITATRWSLSDVELRVVLVVALAKATDAIADCFNGRLQQSEAFGAVAAAVITNGILTLAAGTVLLVWTGSVAWLAVGSVLASVISLAVAAHAATRLDDTRRGGDGAVRDIRKRVGSLMRLMLPLGVTAGLGAVVPNIPLYFVRHNLGAQEVGVDAAMASLASIADLLSAAGLQGVLPRLGREYQRDPRGDLAEVDEAVGRSLPPARRIFLPRDLQ